MNVIKLVRGDIEVDVPTPWSVYDDSDGLLLKAGFVFKSAKKVSEIIERGVYRDRDAVPEGKVIFRKDEVDDTSSPFILAYEHIVSLGELFEYIEDGNPNTQDRVVKLAKHIMWLCDRDMEAALAIIHLPPPHKKYCLYHSIHVALLSSVLAMRMNINDENRLSMIAASLTSNVGMRNLQELLQRQSHAITDVQRANIEAHTLTSVKLLRGAGVADELWLKAVEQHHEQLDGSGYPHGLKGSEILIEASIISIADVYCAKMSGRAGRIKMNVQDALRSFFTKKGDAFSEELSLQLIKELGIFPPGTFVRLVNNETAIVVKRLVGNSNAPIVKSVIGPDGKDYSTPLLRDTNYKEYQVMESVSFERKTPLNYEQIWGYT